MFFSGAPTTAESTTQMAEKEETNILGNSKR